MKFKISENLVLVIESETKTDEFLISHVLQAKVIELNGCGFKNAGFSFQEGRRSHISYVWRDKPIIQTPDSRLEEKIKWLKRDVEIKQRAIVERDERIELLNHEIDGLRSDLRELALENDRLQGLPKEITDPKS